ncbi:MAG: GNAT family N-acetyltransferase [Flavobacteriales bacterium]|nr:GNAT family N-acetyltransferase [Flavobacteriales bacterium]
MEWLVRPAITDRDWSNACAILHRVYVGEGYTNAERAAAFQDRERLEPAGEMLIAVDGEERIGGAVLFLHVVSELRQLALEGEREFRLLGVHPHVRGTGAGEALVRACLERAVIAGADRVVIWSQPSMLAAHRLYERVGFVRAPERDQPDDRGFMRLVFVKELTGPA